MSPRNGSLKRPPATKAEMEERREKLRTFLVKRGEIPIVPADYTNTVSLKVVGEGTEAHVEVRSGMNFARLTGDHLVWQPNTIKSLNEDDLLHLQDALVEICIQLREAQARK